LIQGKAGQEERSTQRANEPIVIPTQQGDDGGQGAWGAHLVCYLLLEGTGAGRKRSPGGFPMSGVMRREFISKGALTLTEPRQLMFGCARCGSTLASQALLLVCPSSNHNGRQKNCGSEGRKSWDMRIGGRIARL
jgi:hypothetical protein